MIQTFGEKDARLYLFDSSYNLLAEDDDSGYANNALLNYNVEANKQYILRVKFYSTYTFGEIKIGITPAAVADTNYDKILNSTAPGVTFIFTSSINTTRAITYTPPESGTYTLETGYEGDTTIDTYLYLVDPMLTTPCLFNDDGGGDRQALITTELFAGRQYFMIVSTYSIATASGKLTITKTT